MAQKLIGDAQHEYTVGIFAYDDGTYSKMICLRRRLSQEGATAKATVVHDEKLENTVMDILKVFKAKGPTNLNSDSVTVSINYWKLIPEFPHLLLSARHLATMRPKCA